MRNVPMRRPSKAPMALPIRKPVTIRSMLVSASLGSVPSDRSSQKVRAVARGDGKELRHAEGVAPKLPEQNEGADRQAVGDCGASERTARRGSMPAA